MRTISAISAVVVLLAVCGTARAAQPTPAEIQQLVRNAVHNELGKGHTDVRFFLRKKDAKGDTTKLIVETKDGDIARLVQKGGKPLSPEDDALEIARLNNLLAHPEEQARRHKREEQDSQHGDVVVSNMADAFNFTYLGETTGPTGLVTRLGFTPKPGYQPPSLEGGVLRGLAGELWIDERQQRMVKLDAHLVADVNFGWGILARLNKGGTILVEQRDDVPNHWEATRLDLNLHGKAAMFMALHETTDETSSGFVQVPGNWTYQDAVHFLLSKPVAQLQP